MRAIRWSASGGRHTYSRINAGEMCRKMTFSHRQKVSHGSYFDTKGQAGWGEPRRLVIFCHDRPATSSLCTRRQTLFLPSKYTAMPHFIVIRRDTP
jgi:hypothetical protein